jgi:hypothetical protein
MSPKARDELRAEIIDFACRALACRGDEYIDVEQLDGELEAFFARQAKIYHCSPQQIRELYASEIAALGWGKYFYGFRPELD